MGKENRTVLKMTTPKLGIWGMLLAGLAGIAGLGFMVKPKKGKR